MNIVLTISGFLIAFLVNLLFPQVAENVRIKEYVFGGFMVDDNLAYRLVLLAIIAYYAVYTVVLFVRKASADKVAKFLAGAKFRFAVGLALAAWDILGMGYSRNQVAVFAAAVLSGACDYYGRLYWRYQIHLAEYALLVASFCSRIFGGRGDGCVDWCADWLVSEGSLLDFAGAQHLRRDSCGGVDAFCADAVPDFVCGGDFLDCDLLLVPGGAGQLYQIFHIAIPHAMPQIFTGIMTAAAFGFTTLVMAEMMGQPGGLGYYINTSKVWSAYYKVFAAIVVMAVLFSAILKVVGVVQRYVLRWQKGVVR